MTGEKMARIRKCSWCEWRISKASSIDQKWATFCTFGGGYLTLDNGFMEGPATNCPLGIWAGLTPADLDAERAAALAERIRRQEALWTAVLGDIIPAAMTRKQLEAGLTKLVTRNVILAEAAVNVLNVLRPA